MLLIAYLKKLVCYYVVNCVSEEGSMLLLLIAYLRMVIYYYVINCVPVDGSMLLCYYLRT
jgi:hypothetical protein